MTAKTPKVPKLPTLGKKEIEWDLVAADYRAGMLTTREIGERYGISHTMVNKRAKADGWTRDLAAKIKQKADEKVSRAVVSKEVSTATVATEAQVVEANADVQMRIRLEHRQDIGRTRNLFRNLLEELEVAGNNEGRSLIEQLVDALDPSQEGDTQDDADERAKRMRRLLTRLLDGSARIDSAKKLTEMLKVLVAMEREAFGIDNAKTDAGYEELLKRVLSE